MKIGLTNPWKKIHNKDMEADHVLINAYAKVNLTLDVLFKRADGYHELEGVMQSISLFDEVFIEKADKLTVIFDANIPENNTCKKAAELYLAGTVFGARIEVKKRIPSEAGLGGASADAAAVLRGLNRLYGLKTEAELYDLGLRVGADVPFCLMGGCAVARGVGEKLTPVKGIELDLLIVRGSRGVSTGKLFSSLGVGNEPQSRIPEGTLENALAAMEKGDRSALAASLANALTRPACTIAPEIEEYLGRMLSLGALSASMTGSGAAVFGVFPDEASAERAYEHFTDCDFRAVCRTMID